MNGGCESGMGVGIGIVGRMHDAFLQGLNTVLLVQADFGQSLDNGHLLSP